MTEHHLHTKDENSHLSKKMFRIINDSLFCFMYVLLFNVRESIYLLTNGVSKFARQFLFKTVLVCLENIMKLFYSIKMNLQL